MHLLYLLDLCLLHGPCLVYLRSVVAPDMRHMSLFVGLSFLGEACIVVDLTRALFSRRVFPPGQIVSVGLHVFRDIDSVGCIPADVLGRAPTLSSKTAEGLHTA